jgi:hypothetical protein
MIANESFSFPWISSLPEAADQSRKNTIERCIHVFYLLGKLSKKGPPFVFNGGTSLMLLFSDPKRFSVDIDIVMDSSFFGKIERLVFGFRDERLGRLISKPLGRKARWR